MNSIPSTSGKSRRVKAVEPGRHHQVRPDEHEDFAYELEREKAEQEENPSQDPIDCVDLVSDVDAEEEETEESKPEPQEPDENGHVDLRI
jgi:hypothetical protein